MYAFSYIKMCRPSGRQSIVALKMFASCVLVLHRISPRCSSARFSHPASYVIVRKTAIQPFLAVHGTYYNPIQTTDSLEQWRILRLKIKYYVVSQELEIYTDMNRDNDYACKYKGIHASVRVCMNVATSYPFTWLSLCACFPQRTDSQPDW